jgi:hypothetical protein
MAGTLRTFGAAGRLAGDPLDLPCRHPETIWRRSVAEPTRFRAKGS